MVLGKPFESIGMAVCASENMTRQEEEEVTPGWPESRVS